MQGGYDALQKIYLKTIVLAVYNSLEDPQTVSECYQFKFKYTSNGPIMAFIIKNQSSESSMSSADTKKASILLIRKIYVLMQNLEPLPNDVCLTMKLFYYDEGTICNTSCFSWYLHVLLLSKLLVFIPNVCKGLNCYIFFEITKFTSNIFEKDLKKYTDFSSDNNIAMRGTVLPIIKEMKQ